MPWTKVKRIRVTTDEPSVTFRKDRISFNVAFVRQSELDKHKFIRLYFDEDERKIGFEFLKEQEDSDVFKIIAAGNKGYSCSSREILDKIWVKKVTKLEKDNSFLAKKDGKMWVVTLCPAFEYSIKREENRKLQDEIKGIYQYKNKDGEIVYIGKGNIKARLADKKRDEWIFTVVEYSKMDSDSDAFEWENFWIDKYKENNNGELPRYNIISGHEIQEE